MRRKTKKLSRTVQCAKCPWKKSTNPRDIPDGYSEDKHKSLRCTIAQDLFPMDNYRAMACHHSTKEDMQHCVGWLHNQLGVGNNIPLRLDMLNYSNVGQIQIKGPQHKRFEDTLPKD